MRLLDKIDSPNDLKKLSLEELQQVCDELRAELIATVDRNGGHLASPLGVVDLTVALHYVFDIHDDRDQLIWDVGHQCYPHKLLTGRRDCFHTIRKQGGISGYPKISESPYDCFGTGHSSTSISAGIGMAVANQLQGRNNKVIALIGDGAMTAGMAWEAMFHAGEDNLDLIVILNDNEMSISRNVGALSSYFSRLITARPYKRAKEDVGGFVKRLLSDDLVRRIQDLEKAAKGLITQNSLFQELGFNYVGPADGHDLPVLIDVLTNLKQLGGPILFHVRTEKGKGLEVAEADPLKYHGVKPLAISESDKEGEARPPSTEAVKPATVVTFTDAFVDGLLQAAAKDERVVAITAAMPTGTGLSEFQNEHPTRFFDVGICEQHAVTFAAGLAKAGMRPVAAIYSTFLQRGYDQLIHDVCIQNLPVVFALDRAGFVGEDSPTQNGTFDLSFLRAVPNLVLAAPRDDADMRAMIRYACTHPGPIALRYARGKAPRIGRDEGRDIRHGEILREGTDATFLAVGPVIGACLQAAQTLETEGLSVGVADARWIKPLDSELLDRLATRPIITVEENTLCGGFGSAVLEYFADRGRLHTLRLLRLGVPDVFTEQGTREEQLAAEGLDAASLAASVRRFVEVAAPYAPESVTSTSK